MENEIKLWGTRGWICPNCGFVNRPRGGREGISKCRDCNFRVELSTSFKEETYLIPKIDFIKALNNN